MKTYALELNDIPQVLLRAFPSYKGKKFHVRPTYTETGEFTPQDMQWSGGSRSQYAAINMVTGERRSIVDRRPFPENQSAPPSFTIEPGWCVVEHSMFRGKDMGITFHVRPDNLNKLITDQSSDLPEQDLIVLAITSRLISRARLDEARRHDINRTKWEESKARLIQSGHLRKNGAITPKGENAAHDCPVRIF